MEDSQFAQLMGVLKEIKNSLAEIYASMPDTSYDLGNIHSDISDVKGKLNEVVKAIEGIELN